MSLANALKANPGKFHLLLSSHYENLSVIVDQYKIYNGKHETLLGVIIDKNLNLRKMLVTYAFRLAKNSMLQ